MNVLLSLLQKSQDYMQLLQAVEAKQAVAVSGLSQAPRSHVLAAAHEQSGSPLVAVCQDDMAAKRLASELGAFLGEEPPVLPSRELTLAGAIGVSRQWEQQRLRLLYALAQGRVPVLVASLDALLLRTMPREVLFSASVRLRCGAEYNVDDLVARLTRAGYTRSSLVEGVGQFALRGGILDVYSPACENPLRAEFFGDELDTMGYFDPITQRRTENVEEAVLLPVAETEAHLHPQGTAGLCEDLRAIIARQQRRKTPNQALIGTLQKDCEALENETLFASADRYMALIYPEFTTAVFGIEPPMPAASQKEVFSEILSEALEEECRIETVQSVQEHIGQIMEMHKENHVEEPLALSKNELGAVLGQCGVSAERVQAFSDAFDAHFGTDAALPPVNMIDKKQFVITTPEVTVKVDPERSDMIELRKIDGLKYILIPADDVVEVNGVKVQFGEK